MKDLEEMLYGLEFGEKGFDESFSFFNDVLENKCKIEEGIILRNKIR